ncbi:WD domain, G-beta repeat domain containing protein [Plasmodium gonderi]|uniref:WD domain, G-beta repeat domain containing protein n=1 Tax=Plasmodium gonderi TaxID=77519 RepID=A0A1Y1JT94_PLAGO|nr:WD domain, G-beta repeat domain containing protein [Plasmodium gonderi]GAW83643.1 WD domain, G-beta repeat domain containing protein [Plasmodium gonderi]
MKFNKRKKFFKIKKNNHGNKKKEEVYDSEVESDDILTSDASEGRNKQMSAKKKKRHHALSTERSSNRSDEDATDNSDDSNGDENDENVFNNPEERKIYLAKKYLRDMGVKSSDDNESHDESSASRDDEKKSESNFSENISSFENDEEREKINKMIMEREKKKSRKVLLNLGNRIKVFHDDKLSSNMVYKKVPNFMNSSGKNAGNDENVFFFRGHKKSVTCVACPDFNLSFFDYYDYDFGIIDSYENSNTYAGYNNGKFYKQDDHTCGKQDAFGTHDTNGTQGDDSWSADKSSYKNIESIMEPKVFENVSVSRVYTGGKDASIIEWDIMRGDKIHIYKGNRSSFKEFGNRNGISHFKSVMDIYCDKFNSFFISVGSDNLINIWDNRIKRACTNSIVGHKNVISAITGSNENTDELNMEHNFFTCSYDKTIKLWDLRFFDKCLNTYLGHTNNILSMNSLNGNKLVTSASDYTLRFWNTKNDNHILFNLNYEIIESCCTLNNKIFISGTFSGHIYIFTSSYKKPICVYKNAHNTCAVTALVSIPFSNIFISGSYDGYVNFWQYKSLSKITATIQKILTVQVYGTVNKFSFAHNYAYLFVAVGDEMKHGKWIRTKNKNGVAVIPLRFLS